MFLLRKFRSFAADTILICNKSNMEQLTKQEEEVMLQIWKFDHCTIKEVLAKMPPPPPPYTTLASTFNKLKAKGYLKAEQNGLTYTFTPLIKQAEYKKNFMTRFVENYFKDSFQEMVSFFAKEQKLSPDDLKEIIDDIEKGEN